MRASTGLTPQARRGGIGQQKYAVRMDGPTYWSEDSLETHRYSIDDLSMVQDNESFSLQDYFDRTWGEYVDGFGDPSKEQWLGLADVYR